jgi:ArsR family transcriptional regulator
VTHHLLSSSGPPLPLGEAEEFATVFQALSDPYRLRIVSLLARNPAAAQNELLEQFPLSQPTVSHHLRRLVQAGLLETWKDGVRVRHQVNRDGFRDLSELLRAGGRTT